MRLRSIFWELVESFKNCEDVDPFADANSVDFLVSSTWVPREERFKSATLGKCLQAAAWKKLIPKKISKKHPKNYQQILFPRNWSTKLQLFLESAWGCRTPLGASKGAVEAACPIWRRQPVFGGPFLKKHPRCNGSPISNGFGNLYFWETTKMMNTSWHLKEYEGLLSRWVLWNFTVFKHREQFQPIFTVLGQLGHKRPPSDALNWSVQDVFFRFNPLTEPCLGCNVFSWLPLRSDCTFQSRPNSVNPEWRTPWVYHFRVNST